MKTKKIVSLILAMVMVLSLSSVFVMATDACYVNNAISQTITGTPAMDGSVSADEYGDPIIVTSQEHANANNDKLTWTKQSSPDNAEQRAKIYMTYDQTYLYIAATLDHATVNTRESGGGGYHPHLAVTLSQNVDNGVFKNAAGNEIYYLYRTAYKGTSTGLVQDFYSARFIADKSVEGGSKNQEQYVTMATNAIDADPETNTKSFFVSYANNTYTFEMRIKLADAPGLKDDNGNYNGADIAMTLEVADAGTNGGDGGYYTIGGDASHQDKFNKTANPHGENVLTIVPVGQFRVSNSVAPMPDVAPTVNGRVDEGEYGAPVIITSQKHATTVTDDQIFWTPNKTPNNKDQQVKVYITNDDTYLYIAATLDHATVNTRESSGGGYHPHLAVTLSQNVDNGVFKNAAGNEIYYLYRTAYKGTSEGLVQDFYSARFTADQSAEGSKNKEQYAVTGTNAITADPETNTKSFFVSYANDTYTFEMRIKLADAPGLKDDNGNYNGADIAMTLEVADAGTNGGDGGYYTIGGNASHQGNFNTVKNPHGENVMTFTCNPPVVAEKTLQEKLDECEAGGTVTLLKEASVGTIEVKPGVTLDLNGCVLAAEKVICYGDVIDLSGGTGGIQIAKNVVDDNKLMLTENNDMLPLYDNKDGCYRFFGFEMINKGQRIGTIERPNDSNVMRYGVHLSFDSKKAYELMADGTLDVDLIMNLTTEQGKLGEDGLDYKISDRTLTEYATDCVTDFGKAALEKNTIVLIVAGMNALDGDTLNVTAKLDTITDMIPSVDVVEK